MTMTECDGGGPKVTIRKRVDGGFRVYCGDEAGGRYANVTYAEIRDFILGRRPHSELVELYNLGD